MREELFKQITNEMFELWKRKNTDYGSSVTDTYKDFGIVSFLVRMQDKMNRLKTITKKEALVKDEKIEDTLIDLANYSILALIELKVGQIGLNDEVEIIKEDKEIEKLEVALLGQCDNWLVNPTTKTTKQDIELNPYIIENIRTNTLYFQRKINELIDEVNKLKGEMKNGN